VCSSSGWIIRCRSIPAQCWRPIAGIGVRAMPEERISPNVLPLVGDGDDVDLIRAVEESFSVKFRKADLENCTTVGDLHRLILANAPSAERSNMACLSALAFYRLRRALAPVSGEMRVRPRTLLSEFIRPSQSKRFWRDITRTTGLTIPAPSSGWAGITLFVLTLAAPVVAHYYAGHGGIAAIVPAAIVAKLVSDRLARFPSRIRTVGDLANAVAGLNASQLLPEGAPMRAKETWLVLEEVIRDDLAFNGSISGETRFFR
jgi:hypothetical protein